MVHDMCYNKREVQNNIDNNLENDVDRIVDNITKNIIDNKIRNNLWTGNTKLLDLVCASDLPAN